MALDVPLEVSLKEGNALPSSTPFTAFFFRGICHNDSTGVSTDFGKPTLAIFVRESDNGLDLQ